MYNLKVNWIEDNPSYLFAGASFAPHALYNINVIYGNDGLEHLRQNALKGKDFYVVGKYLQFIHIIRYSPQFNFTIELYDFRGNVDSVLDEYTELSRLNWTKEIKDKIATLAHQLILSPPDTLATLDLIEI